MERDGLPRALGRHVGEELGAGYPRKTEATAQLPRALSVGGFGAQHWPYATRLRLHRAEEREQRRFDGDPPCHIGFRGLQCTGLPVRALVNVDETMLEINIRPRECVRFASSQVQVGHHCEGAAPLKGNLVAGHQLLELAWIEEYFHFAHALVGSVDVQRGVVLANAKLAPFRRAGVAEHATHERPHMARALPRELAGPDFAVEIVYVVFEVITTNSAHVACPETREDPLPKASAIVGYGRQSAFLSRLEPSLAVFSDCFLHQDRYGADLARSLTHLLRTVLCGVSVVRRNTGIKANERPPPIRQRDARVPAIVLPDDGT
ncbi:MAG: hypothetical protein U0174_03580 [Polyangiaceae bacterium]